MISLFVTIIFLLTWLENQTNFDDDDSNSGKKWS